MIFSFSKALSVDVMLFWRVGVHRGREGGGRREDGESVSAYGPVTIKFVWEWAEEEEYQEMIRG